MNGFRGRRESRWALAIVVACFGVGQAVLPLTSAADPPPLLSVPTLSAGKSAPIDTNSPVEIAFRELLEADDLAQEEIEKWTHESQPPQPAQTPADAKGVAPPVSAK